MLSTVSKNWLLMNKWCKLCGTINNRIFGKVRCHFASRHIIHFICIYFTNYELYLKVWLLLQKWYNVGLTYCYCMVRCWNYSYLFLHCLLLRPTSYFVRSGLKAADFWLNCFGFVLQKLKIGVCMILDLKLRFSWHWCWGFWFFWDVTQYSK